MSADAGNPPEPFEVITLEPFESDPPEPVAGRESTVFTVDTVAAPLRTPGGRFANGNPGRPKGARNKATLLAQAMLQGEAEVLMRQAIDLAKGGSLGALKLYMGRLIAPRRGQPEAFDLLPLDTVHDAPAALSEVATLVADGEITPAEGQTMAILVETQHRVITHDEFLRSQKAKARR